MRHGTVIHPYAPMLPAAIAFAKAVSRQSSGWHVKVGSTVDLRSQGNSAVAMNDYIAIGRCRQGGIGEFLGVACPSSRAATRSGKRVQRAP